MACVVNHSCLACTVNMELIPFEKLFLVFCRRHALMPLPTDASCGMPKINNIYISLRSQNLYKRFSIPTTARYIT